MARNKRNPRFKRKGKSSGGPKTSGLQNGQLRVLANGQSGIARGFMDSAIESGVDCGGRCVEGRMAEDGFISDKYPVVELEEGGMDECIRENIKDSDGTAIIFIGELEDEPEEALDCCVQLGKPYRLIDANENQAGQAAKAIADFVKEKGLLSINIVGTKASTSDRATKYGFETARALLGASFKKRASRRDGDTKTSKHKGNGESQANPADGAEGPNDAKAEPKKSGHRRRRNSGRRFRSKDSDTQPEV